jgi:hypothetical protein
MIAIAIGIAIAIDGKRSSSFFDSDTDSDCDSDRMSGTQEVPAGVGTEKGTRRFWFRAVGKILRKWIGWAKAGKL